MAEPAAIGTEAPYRVVAIEEVTPTIVELWLWPLDTPLDTAPVVCTAGGEPPWLLRRGAQPDPHPAFRTRGLLDTHRGT